MLSTVIAAEETAHGDLAAVNEHAEESKGGLPQFEPEWFASQVFWLAISFAVLYLIFSNKTLPDISSVIENRKNHIQSDLEMAEKLTSEADTVHDEYQENLNKAQIDAAEAIKAVESKAKLKVEDTLNEFRQKSDRAVKEAEKRIDTSKTAAMNDMNQIAVNTAAQAVEKIIGINPEDSKIKAVVERMNGKAKAA